MNDKININSNSKIHFIDALLDDNIPLPDDNARKSAINTAVSTFNTRQNEPIKNNNRHSIWGSINSFFHSLNNNKAFAGVALCFACIGLISILPTGLHKQEIVQEVSTSDIRNDDGFSLATSPAPQSSKTIAPSDLERVNSTLGLEEVVVSGVRKPLAEIEPLAQIEPSVERKPLAEIEHSTNKELIFNDYDDSTILGKIESKAEVAKQQASTRPENIKEMSSPQLVQAQRGKLRREKIDEMTLEQGQITKNKKALRPVVNEPINSYNIIRNSLDSGSFPKTSSIDIEDILTHFNFNFPASSTSNESIKISTNVVNSPWHKGKKIVHIGIQDLTSQLKNNLNDLTLQFEFNSELVSQYQLLSHNRETAVKGINDAGSLTLIYEILINKDKQNLTTTNSIGILKTRSEDKSKNTEAALYLSQTNTNKDTQFSIAVTSFGQKLKGYPYANNISYNDIASLAKNNIENDLKGHKAELIRMVELANSIDSAKR